ncbi:hypothetical protein diail_1835 [Diaporthe ilicicola]|nr:hypothetical protein diail_1835 [Diaporthe ilicicola]
MAPRKGKLKGRSSQGPARVDPAVEDAIQDTIVVNTGSHLLNSQARVDPAVEDAIQDTIVVNTGSHLLNSQARVDPAVEDAIQDTIVVNTGVAGTPVVNIEARDQLPPAGHRSINTASNMPFGNEPTIAHQNEHQMSQASSAVPASPIATSANASTTTIDPATFPKCRFCFKYQRVCDGDRPCGCCARTKSKCYDVPQALLDEFPDRVARVLNDELKKAANDDGAQSSATPASHAQHNVQKKRKAAKKTASASHTKQRVLKKKKVSKGKTARLSRQVLRKRQERELNHCYRAINELLSDKHSDCNTHFLDPFDHVAKNVPHYGSVVKSPMDLSTMKEKLEGFEYKFARHFKADFKRVVNAARLFHVKGSEVLKAANKLEEVFKVVWAETRHTKKKPEDEQVPADA